MTRLRTETWGAGDQSWLGSAHGIANARTERLNVSALTAGTHYPNGYVPSGLPVALVSGQLVPYVSGGAGGAEILAGFILTDTPIVSGSTESLNVPLLDHGRIKTSLLPVAFTAPTTVANNKTTCVFITGAL